MMSDSTMLIQLTAQAEAHGADLLTLRALIEEACELGAARALRSLGRACIFPVRDTIWTRCASCFRPGARRRERRAAR